MNLMWAIPNTGGPRGVRVFFWALLGWGCSGGLLVSSLWFYCCWVISGASALVVWGLWAFSVFSAVLALGLLGLLAFWPWLASLAVGPGFSVLGAAWVGLVGGSFGLGGVVSGLVLGLFGGFGPCGGLAWPGSAWGVSDVSGVGPLWVC